MTSRTVTLKGKAATAWLKRNPYSFLDDDDSAKEPELVINTLQEARKAAFTGAVRGLASQDWDRCYTMGGNCTLNNGKPGFHCAVGWLIPWENQKDCEFYDSDDVIRERILHPSLVVWMDKPRSNRKGFRDFLSELQAAHDCGGASTEIRTNLQALGKRYRLAWPKDVE